jgi:hypothetical protein
VEQRQNYDTRVTQAREYVVRVQSVVRALEASPYRSDPRDSAWVAGSAIRLARWARYIPKSNPGLLPRCLSRGTLMKTVRGRLSLITGEPDLSWLPDMASTPPAYLVLEHTLRALAMARELSSIVTGFGGG